MIEWGRKRRPRKADKGHSAVCFGSGRVDGSGAQRHYIRCECGTRLSGRGRGDYGEAAWRSFVKHQRREAAKLERVTLP